MKLFPALGAQRALQVSFVEPGACRFKLAPTMSSAAFHDCAAIQKYLEAYCVILPINTNSPTPQCYSLESSSISEKNLEAHTISHHVSVCPFTLGKSYLLQPASTVSTRMSTMGDKIWAGRHSRLLTPVHNGESMGGGWKESGAKIENLVVGSHRISFKDIAGWSTPAPQAIEVIDGDTATTVKYSPLPIKTDFVGSPTHGRAPLKVKFRDKSTGPITSRKWIFGGGGSSTAKDPTYTYRKPGAYSVSLVVTGPSGTKTLKKSNYIKVTR